MVWLQQLAEACLVGPSDAPRPVKLSAADLCTTCCRECDVVTINCPLHEGTRGLFDRELIGKMKPGSYLVGDARIVVT